MESSEISFYNQRKIFHPEHDKLRWTIVAINAIFSFISYIFYYNLLLGSFFLFLAIYFMGGFKTRKRIEIFKNSSNASIANEFVNLINSSREELKILSGFVDPVVYCQPDIVNALDLAIKRGVRVQIITDFEKAVASNNNYGEKNIILQWVKNNRLQLFDYGAQSHEYNHFIIADRRSFRLEAMHKEGSINHPALIAYNNKRAHKLIVFYEELIKRGSVKEITREKLQL